ncbi:MAG: DNA repair protein RecO [Burkholderiaceae bacterium]|nr:DNA repair protein RecO [Burkholderiaceae bacterium]
MSRSGAASALPAYVLHRYDWSESSLIVDLFTRELGRVVVAAKGAKRPTSQLRAVLRPFQRIHATLGRTAAGAEVHNLRGAEWAGGVPVAGGDALFSGFYLNELLMKLLAREDPHPALWDAYSATLQALGGSAESAALRAFELRLLREIGLLPDLARITATHAPVQPDALHGLRAEIGVTASAEPGAIAGFDLLALQGALDADDLGALQRACCAPAAALRRPLRELLAYHLGAAPLRTRQVLLDLQPLL